MITVFVSFPSGDRQQVLLAGVPRQGDSIRLRGQSKESPNYAVEQVIWSEGTYEAHEFPYVIVKVRERDKAGG